jgi:hypothetical protein
MHREDGKTIKRFKETEDLGVSHFKSIYKEPGRVNIEKIIKLASSSKGL